MHGLDDTTKVMGCSKPATSLTGKVARATLQPRSFEVTEIEAHAGRDILNAASPASKGGSVAVNDESWRRAKYVIRAKDSKEGQSVNLCTRPSCLVGLSCREPIAT